MFSSNPLRTIACAVSVAVCLIGGTLSPWEATAQNGSTDAEAPENVVFIFSDDHRYDYMGFHERAPDFIETPHLDRMRREGVHIANAFVGTSLCSPSRASILTGQHAHRHGVVDNQRRVPDTTHFFPETLQQNGYQTAFFGKWHMGRASAEPRRGFDHWAAFRGQGEYFDPTLNINGETQQFDGYNASVVTDRALQWLEGRESEDPFFMYLSHKNVHSPFRPHPDDEERYKDVEMPRPESMENTRQNYRMRPDWVQEQRYGWHGVEHMYHRGKEVFDQRLRNYAEALYSMDREIGRVLNHLEQNGMARNTLVVYMGDNGFMWGEHGLIDKRQMYAPSVRVPMLAWSPGTIEPGRRTEEMVQNIDVGPTILDIADADPQSQTDGRSFLPLLLDQETDWRDSILYEYYWEYNFPHTPTMFGLRTDEWKYVFYYGLWDLNELYNVQEDPEEMNNLIRARPELADSLRNRLFDRLEATGGLQIPLKRPRGPQFDERKLPDGSAQ
nr:sulfatase [Salinibacter ruber]